MTFACGVLCCLALIQRSSAMPELPEVEAARCILEHSCVGNTVVRSDFPGARDLCLHIHLFCLNRHSVVTTFDILEYRCDAVADEKVFEGVSALNFSKRMTGSKILAAHRKGKQLWLELDTRPWPCFHLGMSGSFAAITASNEVMCASYVNTKIAVSAELWPPKFWKFTMTMSNSARVAFIAVSRWPHFRMFYGT